MKNHYYSNHEVLIKKYGVQSKIALQSQYRIVLYPFVKQCTDQRKSRLPTVTNLHASSVEDLWCGWEGNRRESNMKKIKKIKKMKESTHSLFSTYPTKYRKETQH